LEFWRKNEARLPRLAEIARAYLSVQPTQADMERSFSAAEYTLADRRKRLSPNTLEAIMFLQQNYHLW